MMRYRRQISDPAALAFNDSNNLGRQTALQETVLEPNRGFLCDGRWGATGQRWLLWIVGRIDDVLNVAGHRLGTSEIESALVSHAAVAESAVVGRPDEMKGQSVVAFVTLKNGQSPNPELRNELRQHVGSVIGAIAKPDDIRFADVLPKTRTGKIMGRLLKELASNGQVTGDTTTLEDLSVLAKLKESEE